jgi:hypothetical protein
MGRNHQALLSPSRQLTSARRTTAQLVGRELWSLPDPQGWGTAHSIRNGFLSNASFVFPLLPHGTDGLARNEPEERTRTMAPTRPGSRRSLNGPAKLIGPFTLGWFPEPSNTAESSWAALARFAGESIRLASWQSLTPWLPPTAAASLHLRFDAAHPNSRLIRSSSSSFRFEVRPSPNKTVPSNSVTGGRLQCRDAQTLASLTAADGREHRYLETAGLIFPPSAR